MMPGSKTHKGKTVAAIFFSASGFWFVVWVGCIFFFFGKNASYGIMLTEQVDCYSEDILKVMYQCNELLTFLLPLGTENFTESQNKVSWYLL